MKLTKKKIQSIIEDEIEVDAYDDDEVNMGWETFMNDEMQFPFTAQCKIKRNKANNTIETVEVIGENSTLCHGAKSYCVEVVFNDFVFTVRLEDLSAVENAREETLRAIAVWGGRR